MCPPHNYENMNMSIKEQKKIDIQKRVIASQNNEIEKLKQKINELEIEESQKDEIVELADSACDEMEDVLDDLVEAKQKYEALINELIEMRNVMEKMVFDGRYRKMKKLLVK